MRVAEPLQLLVTNLDYDDFKGRLVIGRVTAGHVMVGEQVAISKPGVPCALRRRGSCWQCRQNICRRCTYSQLSSQ